MTWHKKGTGTSIHVSVPKPSVTTPKATKQAAQKPAPAPKMAKTGVYAAKTVHFGGKQGAVKRGHVK